MGGERWEGRDERGGMGGEGWEEKEGWGGMGGEGGGNGEIGRAMRRQLHC